MEKGSSNNCQDNWMLASGRKSRGTQVSRSTMCEVDKCARIRPMEGDSGVPEFSKAKMWAYVMGLQVQRRLKTVCSVR